MPQQPLGEGPRIVRVARDDPRRQVLRPRRQVLRRRVGRGETEGEEQGHGEGEGRARR